jgi:hypothetical protein
VREDQANLQIYWMQHNSVITCRKVCNGYSPFQLTNGKQPITPHMVMQGYYGQTQHTLGFMTSWEDRLELAHVHLTDVKERMKHWEDQERHDVQLNIGDQVFIRMGKNQFMPPTNMAPSLVQGMKVHSRYLRRLEKSPTSWSSHFT